ncbi:uncharacterized protein CELE_C54G10.1 [Caenorhabditis elegans]|uniref:Uncharacterized protein n=1 Tax=Caenorhabditis elegans TaxID=6239 RepID=Q18842_CAEEL|nr:Uncharacterized protein CELE_C54G10.1 [Caenorhabditis elegans]CAA99809.1 Uncharacterized protein CELE_C54G10.1 [Caenorhabditis elegans]|eukprot:NP_506618.1 Uncharacterized protein CELE_C54G10.1 [Caenorhabditis elegans]
MPDISIILLGNYAPDQVIHARLLFMRMEQVPGGHHLQILQFRFTIPFRQADFCSLDQSDVMCSETHCYYLMNLKVGAFFETAQNILMIRWLFS